MTMAAEKVKEQALQLPEAERAEIAHMRIVSLHNKFDEDAEAAWDAELDRRVKEIEEGSAHGRPAESVLAEIRAKYGHEQPN
ncbi:MAG: addiction module protein [Verrucomicrobia bacterium]|nr:addiction module protein [Verrucomicrobiota bacterium]